ncbi:uncharacterized protein Z518_10083 [Rhinocladiella mackenziei CBS 650.93]|uniref:Rhinocladiella mackenziei CBS 650.93 unplaced genomic scaffold supercont1.8, whole genome shotgun sequence n=1 Tax=Rhinocladiella mackenziei CBS 650.93 TaxID=1442369 RepID=A0A0D2FGC8_9EURO|nr:uncharacterized protein Z518_10083 [Rhinocladiella mackenziei CBS 650.93]KIX01017.1 hypothetical protein Z518_10083 [Rhinocladiella mackenziei CBS 650.93]
METYNGHVRTPTDAIILFEACRLGILPRVQRRLSEKERQSIRSGSVFVWDEREAGMRRWTDGKSWSASRVSGSFLTYREMEGKRGGNSFVTPANRSTKTPDSGNDDPSQNGEGEEGPDGYRYKPDGLMKQSFSITTSQGQHLHLISYYSRSHPTAQVLRQPSTDPNLASIQPAKGMYPESTINDQSSVPAVTRSPMVGAPGYVVSPGAPGYHRPAPAPPHAYIPHGYIPHPAYIYPISPIHTPPGHYALQPYATLQPGVHPLAYPPPPYAPPHPLPLSQAPPSTFDQRPLRNTQSRSSMPSLPTTGSGQAPLTPYSTSQPPPPPYQSSPVAPANAPAPENGSEKAATSFQIDPRLTASLNAGEAQTSGTPQKPEESQTEFRPSEAPPASASQAPTITALVHSISTNLPSTEKPPNETEVDRQGSTSPGGTKNGAPPQDIPSEKLGFREDKRALSKLDRVFARV